MARGESDKKTAIDTEAEEKKQRTFNVPHEQTNQTADEGITQADTEPVTVENVETKEAPKMADNQTAQTVTDDNKAKAASVKADTHSSARNKDKNNKNMVMKPEKRWHKIAGMIAGGVALVALLASGILSQYFKGRTMPNVSVAGVSSTAKTPAELTEQLKQQKKRLNLTFKTGEKTLKPKLDEIGLRIDIEKTVENALSAKRGESLVTRLAFWKPVNVPAEISINDTLLNQFVETKTPNLSKAAVDSQLQFDQNQGTFIITEQSDGQGPNVKNLKQAIIAIGESLTSETLEVGVVKKSPRITQAKLTSLLEPANSLISRQVVLTGPGYSYQAQPADIAKWITPTPQKDGSIKLVIDSAKIQSYVDDIAKNVSSAPVDKKIIKDIKANKTVVLQEGRNGTELADKKALADSITKALNSGENITQPMNIKTAKFQTVNMDAYDKWIEVDLSEQRTTAYERATPLKNYLIASGMQGHETVTGEFEIWHKVRKQTMQGGSKADGSYYSIPNVEWVSYFYQDYALHGAWWREKFGAPASHGCINMTNADAKWIFDWAPMGTKVIVHS